MNRKKKKAPAAQHLIDSLLNEGEKESTEYKKVSDFPSFMSKSDVKTLLPNRSLSKESPPSETDFNAQSFGHTYHLEIVEVSGVSSPPQAPSVSAANSQSGIGSEEKTVDLSIVPGSKSPSGSSHDLDEATSPIGEGALHAVQADGGNNQDSSSDGGESDGDASESGSGSGGLSRSKSSKSSRSGKSSKKGEKPVIDRVTSTEIRTGGSSSGPQKNHHLSGAAFTSAEAALKQSESLRIAQGRITELEHELEEIRRENEKLASAGETLRRRSDELMSRAESAEAQARESQRIFEEEKKVLRGQLQAKDRESLDLKNRLEEMENRLESNFKKIRVRERELEHRLEISKMENATLISTKDKMILELKRQIDQLTHETEYGKQKTQELFNQYKEKQETIRRVVRALRIALTILEGDEDNVAPIKKAE